MKTQPVKLSEEYRKDSNWYVYILRCADNSLYTGVAKCLQKRVNEHNTDDKSAAKYTRSRRPVSLVYFETCVTRSQACKREASIKKMSKTQKELLVFKGKSSN